MQIINIHQAKTNLSRLINDLSQKSEIIIGKAGKPVAKLVPYKSEKKKRKPGALKGKIYVPDNFDDEDEEINKFFYGANNK